MNPSRPDRRTAGDESTTMWTRPNSSSGIFAARAPRTRRRAKVTAGAAALAAAITTVLLLTDPPWWVVLVIVASWSVSGLVLGLLVGRAIRLRDQQPTPPESTEEVAGDEH